MHDFKTALVNARKVGGSKTVNVAEKRAVIDQLLVTNWDRNALSFWHVKYQKYDKTEGDRLHYTKNLLNGFIQRIDDKLRPHQLGALGVYGEEPDLEQQGVFCCRGVDIPAPWEEHPSFEYWAWTRLDVKNAQHVQTIVEYLTAMDGDTVSDGVAAAEMKVQSVQLYL